MMASAPSPTIESPRVNLAYYLRHPLRLLPRLGVWMWERRHPHAPWLCPGTIRFCEERLRPPMAGLEFGSGRSTVWLAARLGTLTSVEHARDWHARVVASLVTAAVHNVDLRLVPLDHPDRAPEQERYDPTPRYVALADALPDASLDVVLIDGHYRTACIRHAIPKLRCGGFLIVDDVDMWPTREAVPVPADWSCVDESRNGLKRAAIWMKP